MPATKANLYLPDQLSVAAAALHVTWLDMTTEPNALTATERVRSYRKRMRNNGMRPIQIWVPDVRSPEFSAQAHTQSAAVARSASAVDDQAFIDAVSNAVGDEVSPNST